MLMAVESIRQTDNLSRVVNWIEKHVEHEAKYSSHAELLSRQMKELHK